MTTSTIALRSVLLSLFLLTSCATSEPITIKEVEYVPVTMDITESVEILFDARPEYAPEFEMDETLPVAQQAVLLAITYKDWAERWQDYAIKLEKYLGYLQQKLLPKDGNSEPS